MDQAVEDNHASSGSDSEDADQPKLSERRRKHKELLALWIKTNNDLQYSATSSASPHGRDIADTELTVQELMTKHADKRIIEAPRDYQMELFERAKQENTLAVLETGSGKTLIAALLLRWMLDNELQHRAGGGRRRLAFFIVGGVALAFQQHAVLQCNLDHKIEKLYGNLNVDLYSQAQWSSIFDQNMVIVCTAEVLYQCLTRSFIKMTEINILIFDEAHHAKKNHSYSQIMREYYHVCPKDARPRIFGMTASPVDSKNDVVQAALDLENLLDARIATSKSLVTNRPKEFILPYGQPPVPYATHLCETLHDCFGRAAFFSKFFSKAQSYTSELGDWCGDQYWKQCLNDDKGPRMENAYKRQNGNYQSEKWVKRQNEQFELIKEARGVVEKHNFVGPIVMGGRAISSKVRSLQGFLNAEYENPTISKCIVFVGDRQVAFLLVELFAVIGSPHLKCAAMVGTKAPEVGESAISLTAQIRTLSKFEKGELNCLFATTVAEEGIDVADCNVVVRFDLYKTMIQYVQSRGRARHHNSKYVHMLEKGNSDHDEIFKMTRESEMRMREYVEKLPPDRLLSQDEPDVEAIIDSKEKYQVFKKTTAGATLSFRSSQTVLHHFLDLLPRDLNMPLPRPTYVVQPQNGRFICEIIFPEQARLRSVIGRPAPRKGLAKRSAAYCACVQLLSKGYLDEHLMSTRRRVDRSMGNAHLAVDSHKQASYSVLSKPRCWERGWGTVPKQLFATVLDLSDPEACIRGHVPLIMLTRQRIIEIPSFPLWPRPDRSAEVVCTRIDDAIALSNEDLTKLTEFTLQIFKDVFNKEYKSDIAKISYWIAPTLTGSQYSSKSDIAKLIDWKSMQVFESQEQALWTPDRKENDLIGRYMIDPGDGSRRFFIDAVDYHLSPADSVPSGVAPIRKKLMGSIWDYSNSTWGQNRRDVGSAAIQPVLRAYQPSTRFNLFENWSQKEREASTLAYICPEPLRLSVLAGPIASMLYNLPTIIWRIESHLIAEEACQALELTLRPSLSLEALTKDSDNTDEHRKEQLNIQRGMGRNYERLEFLGDCFLKMATTISLYTLNDSDDEYISHVKRMHMICNKNLFETAVKKKTYQYIRTIEFSRRKWYPEGLELLRGKGAGRTGPAEEQKVALSKKTIADICEALIGASLVSSDHNGNLDMAVKAVSATVNSDSHNMQEWSEYYQKYQMPAFQIAPSTAVQLELARKLFKEHDYAFTYPRLAQSAFTHPSYPYSWDLIPNYQRLEFLGDALLDMVCVNSLFKRYPDRDPQWLTEHKMAMVSNKFLGALCVRLGFNRHLRSNDSTVLSQVKVFCEEIDEVESRGKGEADYWTLMVKDPPKCLADIVESYVGAVFVDSEYSFQEVERFFDKHIAPYFKDMAMYDSFARSHPMIALSNMLTETYNCGNFRVMSDEMPSIDGRPPKVVSVVIIHDKVVEGVWSSSSRYGKIKVATNARHGIEGLAPYEYRSKYGCDCKEDKFSRPIDEIPVVQTIGTAM